MGKPQSKRDQQCILMSGKLNRALQEQINKKKCGFNLANYNVQSSVSEFSICCFDSSTKAAEIPLKVELPPKMPVGTSHPHNILLNSQVLNCCDGISKSTNTTGDTNDDNCNKIEPFECELQVDTSSEKKQDWSFTLYDFDGRGKITKEELGNLFQALYDAVGSSIRLPLNGTKKLKLRLSIGHDNSHLDTTLKDQSPPLVKKKAKLKNTTEWKEMSLQAGAVGSSGGVGMVDPKECIKLNNLDASPRAKPSAVSKMENQLTTPGIGHRLMLSCKEQRKLTEMVHENMVRNHVRQQTGRKHHHSGHRHHHHHREARRHRGNRRQGDENRKPHDKECTYYLDLSGIDRSPSNNAISLSHSASVPNATSTTTETVTTTSVMTFAQPSIINIAPSSSPPGPPPPPPPPTASGSTAHCNEIGMAADDDDDGDDDSGGGASRSGNTVIRSEVGGNLSRRKHDNPWRETALDEPATGHGGLTVTSNQQDHHHHHHPHHHHHHHHHHRRRHHPHRNSGDSGHSKCKHCNEKCDPINIDTVKASMSGAPEQELTNRNEKKEILNRLHKHSNSSNININNTTNNNYNSNNINDKNYSNEININNDIVKDVFNNRNNNRELVSNFDGDTDKQDNAPSTHKCPHSDPNQKMSCVCVRCQKMSCRVRVSSWQVKNENAHDLRQRNSVASVDGPETAAVVNALSTVATNATTNTAAVTTSSQFEKKSSERTNKKVVEERHKKHGHHAHIVRTNSQERSGQSGPTVAATVSSSVSAVIPKIPTSANGTPGAIAERKSLRTHHKTESSSQQTASRHRSHCPNTLVPEKATVVSPSALLLPPVSPPPPAPTPTAAVSTTTSATAAMTTTTLQQSNHHHHHHLRRRNQTLRSLEFNEAMQQVADWINREHNPQNKPEGQQSHQGSVNAEHFVHVQRHEHHHVHEYHHHHHYHHYYQT